MIAVHTFELRGFDATPVSIRVEKGTDAPDARIGLILQSCGFTVPAARVTLVGSDTSSAPPDGRPLSTPSTLAIETGQARRRRTSSRVLQRRSHAPADLPKHAVSFDLPIALGLLAASGQIAAEGLSEYAVVGELAMDGSTRPVKGSLSMAISAAEQNKAGKNLAGLIVPAENAAEAAVVAKIAVYPISSLTQAAAFLSKQIEIEPQPTNLERWFDSFGTYDIDYADVRGQESAKRAMMIAAAGSHNLLMSGPPGSGKTMLAKRLPTILPELTPDESIETSRIYSAMGLLPAGQPILAVRPFRSPHHTISDAGLVGGGSTPSPGEISLSNHGVLFLDELPEFNRRTLEVLRQPMEEGVVTISRALNSSTFPAHFMLVAALNPCPCGYRNDARKKCNCTGPQIERYMGKISGKLFSFCM